jgi:hypothetical protein
MDKKRAKPGEVFRVDTSGGFIYLQFLGRHPEYGDAVLVCPKKMRREPLELHAIFNSAYAVFYPISAAIKQGLVRRVGFFPTPGIPTRWRRPGAWVRDRIETWIIEDESAGEILRRELTEDERRLPIAEIWNHEMLIQRVSEGWQPMFER